MDNQLRLELRALRNQPHDEFNTGRWLDLEEADIICACIETLRIRQVVEIGTANGFSASCFALTSCDNVITYDPVNRPKVWDLPRFKEIGENITFINAEFPTELGSFYNRRLFFIDGDHSNTGVMKDWLNVLNVMGKEDVVFFHDVLALNSEDKGVNRLWQRMTDPDNERKNRLLEQVFIFQTFQTKNGLGYVKKRF